MAWVKTVLFKILSCLTQKYEFALLSPHLHLQIVRLGTATVYLAVYISYPQNEIPVIGWYIFITEMGRWLLHF
jgi:pyruvate dehydrogenase complex dehydrogenase (E1) component